MSVRRRHDLAREVEEELDLHIRLRTEENMRAGMPADEARRAAERAFGDYGRIARASLHQRLAPRDPDRPTRWRAVADFFDSLRRDVAHAARGFGREPGLFTAAFATLAIGLGATTAMYSLANWALLRPIPGVEAPEDLSHVWVGQTLPEGAFRPSMLSIPNFDDVAARLTTVEDLAYFQRTPVSVAFDDSGAESLLVSTVSASYFPVLGVRPALGRVFDDAEAEVGADARVAIIGHHLWTSRFDRAQEVLGRTLRINGIVFTVVGVAPDGFEGSELFEGVDLWVPGPEYAAIRHSSDPDRFAERRAGFFYMLLARRAPGVSWPAVSDELDGLEAWLLEQFPETNAQFSEAGFHVFGTFGTPPQGSDTLERMLTLLLVGSALLLLIACANVANLLLIRGLGRHAEVAVRRALGCGRARLFRQHLTEGLLLWLLGGVAGVAVARALVSVFVGARVGYAELADIALDARVLAFSAATALVVGLAFAAFPALASRHVDAAVSLRGVAATAGRRRLWARSALTVAQLAASVTLLVGALLLVRTVGNLVAVDPGFSAAGAYTFSGSTFEMSYSQPDTFAYFAEFERRLRQRPEIDQVAVSSGVPLQRLVSRTRLFPAGEDPEETSVSATTNVLLSPGYFDVFGIPMVRGRAFDHGEITAPGEPSPPVIIVSETAAEQLFGTLDVVGRAVAFPFRSREGIRYEIVGVAADVRYDGITNPPGAVVYEPGGLDTFIGWQHSIAVRSSAPLQLARIAREIGASLDDALPVGAVRSMNEVLVESRSQWTLLTKLIGLLAGFAALLSAVGLYGVVAFMVRARSREIGVRVALGASAQRVFRLVLHSVATTTAVGLVLGLAGAAALVRVIESQLYGVEPFDPGTWTLAAVAMAGVALAASFLPARRATRVDPVQTLRSQ